MLVRCYIMLERVKRQVHRVQNPAIITSPTKEPNVVEIHVDLLSLHVV